MYRTSSFFRIMIAAFVQSKVLPPEKLGLFDGHPGPAVDENISRQLLEHSTTSVQDVAKEVVERSAELKKQNNQEAHRGNTTRHLSKPDL